MQKYTIWIMPNENVTKILSQVVEKNAQKYGQPEFPPHMTLLGGAITGEKADLIQKTKTLAASIKAFPLTLGRVDISSTYFQSVFVRVNTSGALLAAYLKARKFMTGGIDKNYVFMPHISLVYGDFEPSLRAKIAEEIVLPRLSFTADNLTLVPDTSDPHDWQPLVKVPLATN